VARVIIQNVTKVFRGAKGEKISALSGIDLTVEDRECLVLAGPSGSGKSTLLRLLAGLEEPTGGNITMDGKNMEGIPPAEREIAMVFQNPALYPHLTVFENMGLGLKLRKIPKPEIKTRVHEMAELLGIEALLARKPAALSGGERQRVALGRAFVRRPKLLLLDEPLSNLDAPLRAQLRLEFAKLRARLEPTIIYVTHDQFEAMTTGDRVAILKAGVIQHVAEPMTIFDSPANIFVAGFIGSPAMNFFPGALRRNGTGLFFSANNGQPGSALFTTSIPQNVSSRESIICGLRPEHVRVQQDAANAVVQARIARIEPVGSESFVHLAAGACTWLARVPASSALQPGQTVSVAFEMAKAHFFDPATGLSIGSFRDAKLSHE